MYLIVRLMEDKDTGIIETDMFGPFPNEDRAKEYAQSFAPEDHYTIYPLIVPNCVQVKLMY